MMKVSPLTELAAEAMSSQVTDFLPSMKEGDREKHPSTDTQPHTQHNRPFSAPVRKLAVYLTKQQTQQLRQPTNELI